jgi:hypothetical protein
MSTSLHADRTAITASVLARRFSPTRPMPSLPAMPRNSSASGTPAERIFGHTNAEAIGNSLDIITPERLRKRHWTGYRQVMASGESRYGKADVLAVPGIAWTEPAFPWSSRLCAAARQDGAMIGMAAIMGDVIARFDETRRLRQKIALGSQPGGKAS